LSERNSEFASAIEATAHECQEFADIRD
jgi:hypothetical protein